MILERIKMKIIKNGLEEPDIYRGFCNNCKSIIEAEKYELALAIKRDIRDEPIAATVGICPVCSKSIEFHQK